MEVHTLGARKPVSKKTRFEVFKRDSFTCHYCGRKAPDVLLVIDHIQPIAEGGNNDILNLITACDECNAGKGARPLSDTSVIDARHEQLRRLQERKEQMDMLFEWQAGLESIASDAISRLAARWSELVPGSSVTEWGIRDLRKWVRQFSITEILQAMTVAADKYLRFKQSKPTKDSIEIAWRKVGGICAMTRMKKEDPNKAKVYYLRGILRRRCGRFSDATFFSLMKDVKATGLDMDEMIEFAKGVKNWSQWRDWVLMAIGDVQ
ncbi:MAG: HNH endonuclease [Acidobacteriota bacterium]|nr:HNH endonuclease [Acidobacteriota bacterium]